MNLSLRGFAFSRLARAASLVWLCGSGAAWAGGGGEDAPSLQSFLDAICAQVGMTSCPQLPTASQIVLEISGLINTPADNVRTFFVGNCANLAFVPGTLCPQVAVNAVSAPVKSPPNGPLAISYLTPLAFKPGAAVTQYGDRAAKRFLYAAVIEGSDGQPQLLELDLDDTLDTNKQFSKGSVVAFSLPLVVLKNGAETPVTATLQLAATCNGAANCLTGTVTGTFPGVGNKSYSASALGITFDTTFDTSPNSAAAHRIYELQVPIVATLNNDSAYFSKVIPCPNGNGANQASGYCNAFSTEDIGSPTPVLGSGASIGVAPYAAPLCTNATCPPTPPPNQPPPTTYFGFCASFGKVPAVAAFLQIGTDGTTAMTTPVSTQGIQCPP